MKHAQYLSFFFFFLIMHDVPISECANFEIFYLFKRVTALFATFPTKNKRLSHINLLYFENYQLLLFFVVVQRKNKASHFLIDKEHSLLFLDIFSRVFL